MMKLVLCFGVIYVRFKYFIISFKILIIFIIIFGY